MVKKGNIETIPTFFTMAKYASRFSSNLLTSTFLLVCEQAIEPVHHHFNPPHKKTKQKKKCHNPTLSGTAPAKFFPVNKASAKTGSIVTALWICEEHKIESDRKPGEKVNPNKVSAV